jgi:hypothetical protein
MNKIALFSCKKYFQVLKERYVFMEQVELGYPPYISTSNIPHTCTS